MLKSETRTVINLLREGPPSIITVKRAIMILIKLDAQIDRLYKGLNETAKEQYINGRNDGIREFAERLKNKFYSYYEGLDENTSKSKYNGETLMYYEVADMIENCIDNTVKEMTEEDREKD